MDVFRREKHYLGCLLVAVILVLPRLAIAYNISRVPLPPRAEASYIGDVVHNGVPTQMIQFNANQSVQEIATFYKQAWSDNRRDETAIPSLVENTLGEWHVIGKLEGKYSIAIQLKPSGLGTYGLISVVDTRPRRNHDPRIKRFPRIGGSELFSSTVSDDGGKSAVTLILKNNYSVGRNDQYYRGQMSGKGWQLTRGDIHEGVSSLLYSKSGEQCQIAISQAETGETVIFANWVTVEK